MRRPVFNLSLANKTFDSSKSVELSKEEMLKGLDDLNGTPEEQIRSKAVDLVDSVMAEIGGSIGWPGIVKTYDGVKISVVISNSGATEKDELRINFDPTATVW